MGKQKRNESNRTNLASLSTLTDESLAACLRSRYDVYQVYTWLGANQIVCVNPGKPLALNDDQTGLEYVAAYKDTRQQRTPQPPHIYELVVRAYFHMRRTGNDQAIVLSGESGSGKTHLRDLIFRQIVRLSSHKKENKVQTQFLHAQQVLNAFGNAATAQNTNASRFSYYAEIQFSERGRMVGVKSIHYLLEKSRLTLPNEANFNVFYQLLTGASADERTALQLAEASHFRYLSKRPAGSAVDSSAFTELKSSMKMAGFRREHISRIVQLLAAILHLGNLVFLDPTNNQDAAYVKNTELLDHVADLLGVDPRALENVLVFKTTLIRKDVTTLILNAEQAVAQRDDLAKALYSLLFAWMVERTNEKLCAEEDKFSSFIGVLDLPGPHHRLPSNRFYSFILNVANERIHQFVQDQIFSESQRRLYEDESVSMPQVVVPPSTKITDLLLRPSRGVCALIESMTEKKKRQPTDADMIDAIIKYNSGNPCFSVGTQPGSQQRLFTIQHFGGKVSYDPTGFIVANQNQLSVDFISLFRGGAGMQPSWNSFLVNLWETGNGNNLLATESHPRTQDALISAQQQVSRVPSRRQSQRKSRSAKGDDSKTPISSTTLGQVLHSVDALTGSFQEANLWTVFCICPNDSPLSSSFDSKFAGIQIKNYALTAIAQQTTVQYTVSYTHQEFLDRYAIPLITYNLPQSSHPRAQMELVNRNLNWSRSDAAVGSTRVFLSYDAWRSLEDQLRILEKDERPKTKDIYSGSSVDRSESQILDTEQQKPLDMANMSIQDATSTAQAANLPPPPVVGRLQQHQDDQRSFYSDDDCYQEDSNRSPYQDHEDSIYGSESYTHGTMLGHLPPDQKENLDETDEDESKQSATRKRWLAFVWFCTWWIPSNFLIWCGRMKRKDVRIAWREKVTLCIIILILCAFIVWFLVFFGELVCPHQAVFSPNELASYTEKEKSYVAIRGEVFDLSAFAPHHYPSTLVPMETMLDYGGQDVTDLFPIQVSDLCKGVTGDVSPYVTLNYQVNLTDENARYHDFRYSSGSYVQDWYYQQMTMLRKNYKVGNIGFEPKAISDQAKSETTVAGMKTTRLWAYIDNHIYDLTQYNMGGRYAAAPPGEVPPGDVNLDFLDPLVVTLFRQKSGGDISKDWRNLPLNPAVKQRQIVCLRNLFFVGMLDTRNSAKCQFSTYLLLIVTCLLCSVIVFKFLAAFRIGSSRIPEDLDRFVITQVTCYTEDEESLRKTIDSLATLRYDDKRKLLFVICDGMIVGSGNDRPTPRIVLDILGVDPQVDPEPLSFFSVGEGQKQHNMGKIYSGLYETSGHVVPYLVVVKCGKPTERQKPGNRGKRDSQLILMEFLNRVHFDAPMSPLQLEMYHQMKNVIGVTPQMYEFVLMVDADTEVMPDGLSYLASSMAHDSKIIGVCGETTLANEKATWTTMIQVYEYFISHHMIKAFESLFSTVTCLPGCFTMYRIRTVDGRRPLFCSNEIIADYHINNVDTLHKKNLLHLGEDRYLTTLLLKHFPSYKTKFVSHAQCKTNAPDIWSVLVSQRRRWINSTIHNLGELAFLPRLCGFCCFSMRFIVMLDLISTLVMPAIVGYLGYLIYKLATLEDGTVPYLTIIVIGGTYGLQAVLFIIKRRWEYILWMLVSLFAIPIFWFYIPIYAYWHFDDFSWGNTRVVLGEKGKKTAVADEGEFDPKTIPTMTWSQYEKMLLSEDYWSDGMSQASSSRSSYTHRSRGRHGPMTTAGHSTTYLSGNPAVASGDNINISHTPSIMMSSGLPGNMYNESSSVMMPSSASMPMLATYNPSAPPQIYMPVGRASMASVAGHEQWNAMQPQQPVQRQVRSSMPIINPTFTAPAQGDRNSQSLVLDDQQGYGPSNDEILVEVQRILGAADLTKITKKQVREELQHVFGVPMGGKKEYINACIENVLQGRL
ncbi:chitin synthase-domain-containing protein [Dichotomocladium elegans]|nr:chitin synthase-domain-containing protein [Dichotomocladium elegans]